MLHVDVMDLSMLEVETIFRALQGLSLHVRQSTSPQRVRRLDA